MIAEREEAEKLITEIITEKEELRRHLTELTTEEEKTRKEIEKKQNSKVQLSTAFLTI